LFISLKIYIQIQGVEEEDQIFPLKISKADFFERTIDYSSCFEVRGRMLDLSG